MTNASLNAHCSALTRMFSAAFFGLLVLALAGCTDEAAETLMGPDDGLAGSQAAASTMTADAPGAAEDCEIIDFNSYNHGDPVTSATVFGTTLSFSASRYVDSEGNHGASGIDPYAFDTDLDGSTIDDDDLTYTNGSLARDDLETVLVIPHYTNFAFWGDWRWGGELEASGFSSSDGLYVRSFLVADNDDNEPDGVRLYVDGTLVATSTPGDDGSVQTVSTGSTTPVASSIVFEFGTEAQDNITGSGGIDNIELCREVELGEEGCTLGYWKTHTGDGPGNQQNAWLATGYDPDQTLESVFDVPDGYDLDDETLLEALDFKGGGGTTAAARLLLKQAVAAVLSAAHPDVAYGMTEGSIITQVNAALASEDRSTMLDLKDELDALNNAGCPL